MYGGTKSELERLVSDAEELTGQALDPSKFSDVITAIHAVQENMGITGTTAKEAATTIQGSVGMMQAAWSNLVVGIADENADLTLLIGNLASSIATVAQNVGPRILQIFQGISSAAEQIAPMIASGITTAVQNAPVFLNAAVSLLQSLGSSILSQADALMESAMDIVTFLADAIISNVDGLAESAVSLVQRLADFVSENAGTLAAKAADLLLALANAIIENLPELASAALQIVVSLATGIINNIPRLIEAIPTLISKFVEGFSAFMSDIVDIGKNIVEGIWEGISGAAEWLKNKVTGFFSGIVDGAKDLLGIHSPSTVFADMGRNMALGLGQGWESEYDQIRRNIENGMSFGTANVDFASSGLGMASAGMVNGIASAVSPDSSGGGPVTINLVLPDGTKFASWQLPFLINAGRAAGTPIANPQVG